MASLKNSNSAKSGGKNEMIILFKRTSEGVLGPYSSRGVGEEGGRVLVRLDRRLAVASVDETVAESHDQMLQLVSVSDLIGTPLNAFNRLAPLHKGHKW